MDEGGFEKQSVKNSLQSKKLDSIFKDDDHEIGRGLAANIVISNQTQNFVHPFKAHDTVTSQSDTLSKQDQDWRH